MAATKDEDTKAMDVAKPGTTTPDTSARPVLVTHRPMVQDPMVNQGSVTHQSEPKKSTVSHTTKVLQPVDASSTEDESNPSDDEESKSKEAAVVEAVADQADTGNNKDGKLTEADKARQEHIQKLLVEKTYFVPIGQVAARRNRRATTVVLVLLLLVVSGYVAVDVGIIKTSIKLPINLIKN